jgi:hypothetical protein
MEIVKGETWRDKREEILGEERATLLDSASERMAGDLSFSFPNRKCQFQCLIPSDPTS